MVLVIIVKIVICGLVEIRPTTERVWPSLKGGGGTENMRFQTGSTVCLLCTLLLIKHIRNSETVIHTFGSPSPISAVHYVGQMPCHVGCSFVKRPETSSRSTNTFLTMKVQDSHHWKEATQTEQVEKLCRNSTLWLASLCISEHFTMHTFAPVNFTACQYMWH